MNNPNRNTLSYKGSIKLDMCSARKDYPSEVEETYRQDSLHLLDLSACQAFSHADGMAECLTPIPGNSCSNSMPFANALGCKHPPLIERDQ